MIACEAGKQELLPTGMLCRRVGPAIHQSGGKPRRHAHTQHNTRSGHTRPASVVRYVRKRHAMGRRKRCALAAMRGV